MPRKARIDAPGPLHHVIDKGIARKKVLDDDDDIDRDFFLDHFPRARRRYKDFVLKGIGQKVQLQYLKMKN